MGSFAANRLQGVQKDIIAMKPGDHVKAERLDLGIVRQSRPSFIFTNIQVDRNRKKTRKNRTFRSFTR